jgi:hypothetical protein
MILMTKIVLFLLTLTLSSTAFGQLDTGNPLNGLAKLKDFETRRASSSDPDWRNGNGDCRWIKPGGTLVLGDLEGPGQIVHFWCTIADRTPGYSSVLLLRIYWDGETDPSVECPIGDFFGIGHGVDKAFTSLPVRVSSEGRGRNCYWPMPFHKSARIEIVNQSDLPCDAFYYYIDWQKLPSLADDVALFHAKYRQEFPCVMGQNYLIADIEGRGHYVGTVQSVYHTSPGWYGEGDDFFFIDGEKEPSLRGTGTEDYFCNGWGFTEQAGPFYGTPLWEGDDTGDRGSAYRWHIPDPITFKKSLHVEIEHKGGEDFPDGTGTGYIERDDLMSSVAFWYQIEPHKPWPAIPEGKARLPFRQELIVKGHDVVAKAKYSEDAPTVQDIGDATDGKQFWYRPTDEKGWVEIPFETSSNQTVILTVRMLHARDYGIYRVLLDGKEVGRVDLYGPGLDMAEEKLGQHTLEAGSHTLRFEGAGKSSESIGYFLGFDSLSARIPVYSRPKSVDLRTLQKK